MDSVVRPLREGVAVLLLSAVTLWLVLRLRSASPLGRRTVAPVAVAGAVSTGIVAAFLAVRQAAPDAAIVDLLGTLWALSLAAVGAAFLVGLVRRRLLIAHVLGRLSVTLGGTTDAARLGPVLAAALGDRSLEVRLWSAEAGGWVSADGRRSGVPDERGRATLRIDDAGSPAALLEFDDALCADDELLDAVASQTRAALHRMRVTAELASSLAELARSRTRIAAAATRERARIERDLHDGAQQRLIALRIRLSIAEELLGTDPGAALGKVRELGPEIDRALDDVRALAHGIYPSALTDHGLAAALRSVVRDAPLPVQLRAEGVRRHAPEVESALYFTCVEALQNAAKHASGASGVWISLREGDALSLEVRDDGAGFIPPAAEAAGGLRNMADRIEAAGGRLTVDAAPGRGTRVVATIPLAQ
jgi:signal transduction histidine kinase